ncbi:MAG: NUDIX hydrolase [Smithella sp.]|jgi:ADP-ribose pyrophosphatase|nr:NUDIX hydrolase [Smithella sp.]
MEKSKKEVYTCRIFTVWEEEFALPDGKTTKQSWVDHKPTVAVVAVNDQNEILLIRQFRNPAKQVLWEIPAGTMDKATESPAQCALRELAEETGYSARSITPLFAGYLLPGYCNEYMHFFLASGLVYKPLPPDESEFIEVTPTGFEQTDRLIRQGEIIDAKTVLGVMLARQYLTTYPT